MSSAFYILNEEHVMKMLSVFVIDWVSGIFI